MYLAMSLDPTSDPDLQYAQQLGIDWIIADPPDWKAETLAAICNRVRQAGLRLAGLECLPPQLCRGTGRAEPQHEKALATVCQLLRVLGDLGVPMVGYRWFASTSAPTMFNLEQRGRAPTTLHAHAEDYTATDAIEGDWSDLGGFLSEIMPVAEASQVRLAHQVGLPDAPGLRQQGAPLAPLQRLLALSHNAAHGLDLDHGFFAQALGVDATAIIGDLCRQEKVFAVRLRSLWPAPGGLAEHFLDEDSVALLRHLQAYQDAGFQGPVRVASPRVGEDTPAGHTGQAFSIGYVRALLQAIA